jgi:hypothetical protein
MKMLVIGAVAALAVPTFAPDACAQDQEQSDQFNLQQRVEQLQKEERERKERAIETDKAYQRTLKAMPSDAAKVDPWGNIRAQDAAHAKQSPQTQTAK